MAFNNTVVARAAAGIWGLKLGNATMSSVLAQSNTATLASVINGAFNQSFANTSNSAVADAVVANLGLTGTAATDGKAYLLAQLTGVATTARGAVIAGVVDQFAGLGGDATYGAAALAFNARVAAAAVYSSTAGTQDTAIVDLASGTSFTLSTTQDRLTGSAGADLFSAYIFDNSNTLQSGDFIDGGAGVDTLYADMGSSAQFAVTPVTRNLENITIRAQARATDNADNNVASEARVDIDAERIVGATKFESNNSRADLIVEDVRILSSQITKDITVAFVDSDPGNVDFGVYFDHASLTANRTSSSSLILQALDTKSVVAGSDPLLNLPYDGVSFSLNGQLVVLQDATINNATTFAQLLTAIQARLAASTDASVRAVTASLGATFTVIDADTGRSVNGTSIVLSATGATFGIGNWLASQGVPANSSFYTNQTAGTSTTEDLVTSTILLDNVGRGAYGGDLVVGGLPNGETTGGKGVDRFEVTVERTSRVQNLDSTMTSSTINALKEVTIKNGTASGSLFLRGNQGNQLVGEDGTSTLGTGQSAALPGAVPQHDAFGLNDVRLIDATAMRGAVSISANVSTNAFAKYIQLADTAVDPAGDNVSLPGKTTQVADFKYSGGVGNDTFDVTIDSTITASNSNVQVGREDFTFNIAGGAGNDTISLRIVNSALDASTVTPANNWYETQQRLKNISIDAGDGNDIVRTPGAGDIIIDLGSGNDRVYTDNTGAQAVTYAGPNGAGSTGAYTNANGVTSVANGQNGIYVFNTADQTAGATVVAARQLDNLRSDTNESGILYRAKLTVNFKGITNEVTLPTGLYSVSDLNINQKIKEAIVSSPALSAVLSVADGPGYSLVVKSTIDGVRAAGDLTVSLARVAIGDLTTAEKQAVWAEDGGVGTFTDDTAINTILDTALTNFNTNADYATAFGNNGAANIVGAASTSTSDNRVTPGAGNDIVVLGTTVGASTLLSSNEVVVYSGSFGDDVIYNFAVTGNGADQLSVAALGGRGNAAGFLNDVGAVGKAAAATVGHRAIIIDDQVKPAGATPTAGELATTNTTAEAVARYFLDSANTTVKTHVVIVVDTATNKANVWSVTDAVGDGGATPNISAVLSGSIDLADTLWANVVAANFTNS